MKTFVSCLMLLPVLFLTGCYTTGLSHRDYEGRSYSRMLYGHMENRSVAAPVPENSPDQFPVRLAIAQAGEFSPPPEVTKALESHPELVAHVFSLPLSVEEGHNYRNPKSEEELQDIFAKRIDTLLQLAQNQGADQLMIMGGRVDSRTLDSPLQMLNILIVPYFLVPSQKVEVDAHAAAMVLDVKTGGVIATLGTTVSTSAVRASAYTNQAHSTLAKRKRPELIEALVEEYVRSMTR